MVTAEIKDLNNNGGDGYNGSVAVLMVLQFGGGWNFSGTLPQNGILASLIDLLASPQVKTTCLDTLYTKVLVIVSPI